MSHATTLRLYRSVRAPYINHACLVKCVILKQTLCHIHTKLSQSEHDTTPTLTETHVLASLLMVSLYSWPHMTYCRDDVLSPIYTKRLVCSSSTGRVI